MIQPDANADDGGDGVPVHSLSVQAEPLSSLPTDEVGETIARLDKLSAWLSERNLDMEMPVGMIDPAQAASTLSRLRGERDELDRKYRIQFKATSHACNVADEERDRADKAEDLNRKLVEGLRETRRVFGDPLTRRALGGHNEAQQAAMMNASALVSGGEAAGEDGP